MIRLLQLAGIALLLLVAPDALAQGRGKIAGTVTDAATGDPLPGVNVIIDGTTMGAVTDMDGDYFIANLETGTYDVRASFVGYSPVLVQGVSVSNDRTTDVDFSLSEETLVGEEVVVTAERPLVETDNTTSVVRLESQEVTSRPTTELTDVLNTLPSINEDGGNLTVRGGALDEVAFMVDGARARNPLNHNPYTRINLSAIAELEVITGSFNAEYGEAQSGVINVVTKEGGENYEVFLDARYEPAGLNHWGTSFYDRSSPLYWENSHARHLEWWIEYPDMWVDPNGVRGSDPRSIWTPEQAYQNYLDTHRPLTDYTDIPSYQMEVGLGGPVPGVNDLTFFGTIKRRSEAPLLGNAYRDLGLFTDGTLKLTYRLGGGKKLSLSGFFGTKQAG
ncbi:MAG TPA: carboxypeptidase-like regulatory domain-containing protein, partial [Rhodothermales bacterium]